MKIKIIEQLQKTRNPHEIARNLDVKLSDVRRVMHEEELAELPGWGKTHRQVHILSRRHAFDRSWPAKDHAVLQEHRRLHDQGRVTMCQGRDGEYIIQYAIPSKTRIKRLPYFYGG